MLRVVSRRRHIIGDAMLFTLLLGLKMASPWSIFERVFSASVKEQFMKEGCTITLLKYSVE